MKNTDKQLIESKLKNLLTELLEYGNQEDGLVSLTYNQESQTCTVTLNVVNIEEDNYIGFAGY